jgi:integrase
MAGTVRHSKIETATARLRLKPGRKAYWRSIVPGRLSVGYTRKAAGEPGRWLVRTYLGNERYAISTIGYADDYSEADGSTILNFADATAAARRSTTAETGSVVTVADAMREHIEWLKINRATGREVELTAKKLILPQLGKVRLADLTTAMIERWRDNLAQRPALARSALGAPQNFKSEPQTEEAVRARKATANRVLNNLRAALSRAFQNGHIDSDKAWKRAKNFAGVNAARPHFLTTEQASRLINAADPEFRPLVRAALETGARYSELARARVKEYRNGRLHIARSKSGLSRDIVLSEAAQRFFATLTVGRNDDDLLLPRADGSQWLHAQQYNRMQATCDRARIAVTFHALRHTYASISVMNGMPMIVLAKNLGHTSIKMTERHYAHLTTTHVDEQILKYAPRYGVDEPTTNVQPLRRAN